MRTHNPSRRLKAILLLLTACLLVSSCTSLSVVNNSSRTVQVRIMISPFDGGKLTTLPPGGEEFELSPIGGFFEVALIRDTKLLEAMNMAKASLEAELKKPTLDPTDVLAILGELDNVRHLIAIIKPANSTDSCSGMVPDYASATGIIVDTSDGGTEISSCAIEQPTTEGEPSS